MEGRKSNSSLDSTIRKKEKKLKKIQDDILIMNDRLVNLKYLTSSLHKI